MSGISERALCFPRWKEGFAEPRDPRCNPPAMRRTAWLNQPSPAGLTGLTRSRAIGPLVILQVSKLTASPPGSSRLFLHYDFLGRKLSAVLSGRGILRQVGLGNRPPCRPRPWLQAVKRSRTWPDSWDQVRVDPQDESNRERRRRADGRFLGSAGIAELAIFHPVRRRRLGDASAPSSSMHALTLTLLKMDTIAKRLMSNQTRVSWRPAARGLGRN